MYSSDATPAVLDAARRSRRADALERELYAVRTLRAEVELMQPGLLLDRLEGWHAGAAEHYAERVRDVRLALAGAAHLLATTERALAAALERERTSWAVP
ncbi:hypothetical protein [Agromyces sp. ZXT2-6]|uniref:hypothetical protein n=1 Tax=Agromyces sp. ZXT2-6 TaxID=3461153 RepID=UPI004054D7EE